MTADWAHLAARTVASDDLNLVHASKNGDVAAFEQLVKRYDRKLFRIAQHITHNWEDAEDAVQEAFLKAFQHLGEFREDSKFSTWLIRITLNQSLMKLRKQRCTIKEVPLEEDFKAGGDGWTKYLEREEEPGGGRLRGGETSRGERGWRGRAHERPQRRSRVSWETPKRKDPPIR